ncbi:MAG: SDR family NAD(P)-dependent oxidoreductase [Chloroflexi bacterium]|nr:MAG: SDR family NAD(P)-dependent oxidoreductase [Chloroflexota bacterium]
MAAVRRERSVALVTGASSGIGASYAARLAQDGYDLVLVARRRDRLEELAGRLRTQGSTAEVLPADLTDPGDLTKVETRASRGDIEFLVNNAGFAGYRPFAELDSKIAEDLIRLHVLAVTRLTRAALPGMLRRHSGAIVNVASLLSLSGSLPANPLPYRATYAGAKAFILTFTQALAGELPASGVRLQDTLNVDRSRMAAMAMQPDEVVTASVAALEQGELICVPGLEDPGLIEQLTGAQRAVMQAANRPQLAVRYQAPSRSGKSSS